MSTGGPGSLRDNMDDWIVYPDYRFPPQLMVG